MYVTKTLVTHSVTGKLYPPGELFPVDHLTPEQVALLVSLDILEETDAVPVPVTPSIETDVVNNLTAAAGFEPDSTAPQEVS